MDRSDDDPEIEDLRRELDALRQKCEEYRHLASFPVVNPTSIFEFSRRGTLVYLNPAAQEILSKLNLTDARAFLPNAVEGFNLSTGESIPWREFREIMVNNHNFETTVVYSPEFDTLRVYAYEVSRLRSAESELKASREELIRTQRFLEAVTKGTEVLIATIDINYCFTYFNQAYLEEIKRLSGVEIRLGMNLLEVFSKLPELQKDVAEEWGQVLRGESTNKIIEFGDAKIYRRTYNVLHTPIWDSEGNVVGAGEVDYNISDQMRIQQALNESESRYHALFDAMNEGFAIHEIIFDENGKPADYRFLDINPAFERLTGLKREAVVGNTYRQVLPAEGDTWLDIYATVVATGKPIQFEQYAAALNRYYEVFAYRCAPDQFATIFLDITARRKMEDDLQVNLTKYLMLFDTFPLGVTVTDKDGNIIESNAEASKLVGLSEEEQLQRTIDAEQWKVIRLDGSTMPVEEFASVRALKEHRRIENVEMGILKGNQEVTWISVTASPIPLEDYGIVITYHDITQRIKDKEALRLAHEKLEATVQQRTEQLMQANIELREEINERRRIESELLAQTKAVDAQRKRFNDVLEILPMYTVLLTPDYHVSFANKYFRERFGEDKGRPCFEYLFGLSEPCENCETYKVLQKNTNHHWEWTGPDGRIYDVYDFIFNDVDGSSMILELGIDITERKQAEEQLRRLNAYNRSLIEANVDALVTITAEGKIGDVNSVTERMTGRTRDELIGTDFSSYFTDPDKARQGYQHGFDTGKVQDYELEIQHKDGHTTPVVYNASVYHDEYGNVAGVFAAARDITERKQVESKLRQLNAYNRSLIEASLDALVTITPDGKIGDVNSVTEAITGYKREELVGKDFHSYFTAPEKARSGYQKVFETGVLRDYELEIQHKDGQITPVTYNASVYRDSNGQVGGVFAAARDITERKQAERQLTLLTTALEKAANGIILVDQTGAIVWSNPAFSRMTGYAKEEILGQNPRFLKSGKQDAEFYRNLWQTILAGEVWRGEIINRRKDGSLYYEEQTITPVFDQGHNITNFISIRRDITEHKRAEEALRKSEQQYRSLVIATAQIVWQTNANGEVTEDNPLYRGYTGQTLEESLGKGWLEPVHPADQERVGKIWAHAVDSKTPYEVECRIKNHAGEYRDFYVRAVPVIEKDGTISSWIGTSTDITDKKNYENQLIQAEKHAVIGRMVGSVTHEINNPLQTIKNCLYLIQQETPPDSNNAEPLEMALSETTRLSNLVGQLRQLYRPKYVQTMQSHDLLDIIEEVHSLVNPHLNSSRVIWHSASSMKSCQVKGVKEQLLEVFLNICMNAVEAMQPDGGDLFVDMNFSEFKDKVGVIIKDTGPGISAELLPHIFEPFITTKEFGLGLGLSICYEIIRKHGGQIQVDSQLGSGTTFTLWLPVLVS